MNIKRASVALATTTMSFGLVLMSAGAANATTILACDDTDDYHVTVEVLNKEYAEVCVGTP